MKTEDIKKMARALEEVKNRDTVNELSKKTLGSYVKKSGKERVKLAINKANDPHSPSSKHRRKLVNREVGHNRAVDRLIKEKTLDELSQKTIKKYTKKAARSINKLKAGAKSDFLNAADMKYDGATQADRSTATKSGISKQRKAVRRNKILGLAKRKMNEAKMDNADVLAAAKKLAANGKNPKTKEFGQGLVDFYKKNGSFTPDQVSGLQNIMKKASFQFAKENTVNELSKKTLGSYVKKAVPSLEKNKKRANNKGLVFDRPKAQRRSLTRKWGINKAVDKLAKEDIVRTADKKPENYIVPDGKKKTRMVPNKHIVKEDYKDVEDFYIDKIVQLGSEINSLTSSLVSTHNKTKPGEDGKLYDAKYLVRQLEDVRDSLKQKEYNPKNNPLVKEHKITPIRAALLEMNSRERQTAGATPPEGMYDKLPGAAKEFLNKHPLSTPHETDINQIIKDNNANMHNQVGKSPKRMGDK